MESISQISIETLISYHKQEGIEELTYLTILFTVIIGIIGYLGTAQRIEKSARLLILLFYTGLHFAMVMSFLESMKIHSALHEEIRIYVEENPLVFYKGEKSPLFNVLKTIEPHNLNNMRIAGYLLLAFVVLSILSVGENRILHWSWLVKKRKPKKKKPQNQ
ncbi:hypothetical protein [Flavivirga eckloniae]|uniref:Uncharacterized protein n=1 Tax=Flavivirga eckloniae TaxID=1803846 RepID=A0A2K9PUX7_9FLAO|nr:hypothetical protein [Flavivirga eckloniae]AUP80854.1 hypothetical protein C1H87_19925 [Flavivirga eckloniae]